MEGLLLVNKAKGETSFDLVARLRRTTGIRKIGHGGTLDPLATGVMVLLIGRSFTRLADQFLLHDKEYRAELRLGQTTSTFDSEGPITSSSPLIPSLADVEKALGMLQGNLLQVPPMFSAKKVAGKKLYELARQGIEIERKAVPVRLHCTLLSYRYPYLEVQVTCSKGTYIRSYAHDLGGLLGCGAYLQELTRLRSGPFELKSCLESVYLSDREKVLEGISHTRDTGDKFQCILSPWREPDATDKP